jgi:hypothetical protein
MLTYSMISPEGYGWPWKRSAIGFLGGAVCWLPDAFDFFFLLFLRFFFLPRRVSQLYLYQHMKALTINWLAVVLYGGLGRVILVFAVLAFAIKRSWQQSAR